MISDVNGFFVRLSVLFSVCSIEGTGTKQRNDHQAASLFNGTQGRIMGGRQILPSAAAISQRSGL